MEHLDGLMKLVENELDSVLKNGKFRSREEIDSVYKLVDIVKDSMEIGCMEDEMYEGGSSYGNRRGDYYGRNNRSMGRYSRDSYRGGSYGRGYSRGDDYREHLMEAMDNAPDEQTRQSIQRMLDSMK